MTKTTEELATEVMRLPGWLDAEEEPDSADAAHIVRTYSGVYADWKTREIVYWPEAEIPDEAFLHIVRIIADMVAPSFDDVSPTEVDVETGRPVSMGMKGWAGLRRLTTRPQTGLPARSSVSYM